MILDMFFLSLTGQKRRTNQWWHDKQAKKLAPAVTTTFFNGPRGPDGPGGGAAVPVPAGTAVVLAAPTDSGTMPVAPVPAAVPPVLAAVPTEPAAVPAAAPPVPAATPEPLIIADDDYDASGGLQELIGNSYFRSLLFFGWV